MSFCIPLELPKYLHCGSPVCASGLGHSGAALPAHGGLQGKQDPRWHNGVLVLLRHEDPLCCRWRHGCALPEDQVSVHESTLSCSLNTSEKISPLCLPLPFSFSSERPRHHSRLSHEDPVKCCGYCEEFRQVVSCSEGSVRTPPQRDLSTDFCPSAG